MKRIAMFVMILAAAATICSCRLQDRESSTAMQSGTSTSSSAERRIAQSESSQAPESSGSDPYYQEFNHFDEYYDRPECYLTTDVTDPLEIGATLYRQLYEPYMGEDVPPEWRVLKLEITSAYLMAVKFDEKVRPKEFMVRILYDYETALPYEECKVSPSNGEMIGEGRYRDCGFILKIRRISENTYRIVTGGTGLSSADF